MTRPTCPTHPGIYTDTRPCYRCPQPEEVPVDDATVTVLEQAARRLKDTNLSAVPDTGGNGGSSTGVMEREHYDRASVPDAVTVDGVDAASIVAAVERAAESTWRQATLDDTLFPPVRRADTPMVKVTISGTVELTQADYLAFLDGSRIGPGAVVEIRAAGYVVQPGSSWTKYRQDGEVVWQQEGRVKVRLTGIESFMPTGEEYSDV